MQTVDLGKYITDVESLKKDLINLDKDRQVPEKRIIKDHLGDNNYRILLCTYNEPSFQGEYIFQITKELLTEQMDKLVGVQIGELDQRACRERLKDAKSIAEYDLLFATKDITRSCGVLFSYEIVENVDSGVIELFGLIRLSPNAIAQLEVLPHYFSMRCIGDRVSSQNLPHNFKVINIGAFDMEPALFN